MNPSLSTLVAEWTWAKRFVDQAVQAAERCDVPRKDLAAACLLSGKTRQAQLQRLGAEVRKGQEDLLGDPKSEAQPVPVRWAGLVQHAVVSLRLLAVSGDERAGAALTYLILLHPEHVSEEDRSEIKTFHAAGWPGTDARSSSFMELNRKLEFARDVGRSLYMDCKHPTWEIERPKAGDYALLVLCEHSSAILAGSYRMSSHWHIVRVKEVRRMRFSATLLARPDLPKEAGRIRPGQDLEYHIASLVTFRRTCAQSKAPFTFRVPASWRSAISDDGILPMVGPQPWPSKIAGWDACFRVDGKSRLSLYLIDLAQAEGRGGWADDQFFMAFTPDEIDSGKCHSGRIGQERFRVRCVWDEIGREDHPAKRSRKRSGSR